MAHMYPSSIEMFDGPYSEKEVYKALSSLSDEFYIFHSFDWAKKKMNSNFTWFENDFVILNRKYGILFLEVKGGIISMENGIMYQERLDNHEINALSEGNDPYKQAKRGVYYFRNLLDKIINKITDRLVVEPLIWFPSCEKGKRNNFSDTYYECYDAILDCNNLKNANKSIYDVLLNFYKADVKTSITEEEFRIILRLLTKQLDLVVSPSALKGTLDDSFVKMTREQSVLLDYISEQPIATIQGAAGTGKTLIALEAAKRFSDEGRKVLFLCFNRFLYEHLKYNCFYKNVTFYNINTFVKQYKDYDAINGTDRAKMLNTINPDDIDFDDIIIDEAQDFENDEILFFTILSKIKEGHLFIFYDKNQLVLSDKVPSWIQEADCKLLLTKNCRNTYQIACTAYNVIDSKVNGKLNSINGESPTMSFVKSNAVISVGKLIKMYKDTNNEYTNDDIVILTLKTEEKSFMKDVNCIFGINISNHKEKGKVLFTTAKKFKGLESKVVIIVDIDENDFNDDASKRVFYVACSRAKHRLSLVINGNDEKIQIISNYINQPFGNAEGKILMKTMTKKLVL